jgi:hypothetical protein
MTLSHPRAEGWAAPRSWLSSLQQHRPFPNPPPGCCSVPALPDSCGEKPECRVVVNSTGLAYPRDAGKTSEGAFQAAAVPYFGAAVFLGRGKIRTQTAPFSCCRPNQNCYHAATRTAQPSMIHQDYSFSKTVIFPSDRSSWVSVGRGSSQLLISGSIEHCRMVYIDHACWNSLEYLGFRLKVGKS